MHKIKETRDGREIVIEITDHLLVVSPGMRIVKTALAVLLCLIIDYYRQPSNYFDAAIAAFVCMQNNLSHTWEMALSRVIATIIAGIHAIIFQFLVVQNLGIDEMTIPYFVLLSLFIILLMVGLVELKMLSAISTATVVFILILVTDRGLESPYLYTVNRAFNTIIGVVVAFITNWLPPLNKVGRWYDEKRSLSRKRIEEERE